MISYEKDFFVCSGCPGANFVREQRMELQKPLLRKSAENADYCSLQKRIKKAPDLGLFFL